MALRKRRYSKRVEKWMLAHYQNPRLFTQKDVMKRLGLKYRTYFYAKFYQVIIDERIKEIDKHD